MKKINRGDIYICNLKQFSGSIQRGIRPVVIIQNDMGNKFSPTIIVIPLTTSRIKKSLPTHTLLKCDDVKNGYIKESIVLCEQIQVIDRNMLLKKVGTIKNHKLNSIERSLLVSLGYQQQKEVV